MTGHGGQLVLALDIGTSSVRTALYSSRGARLQASTAQRGYRLTTDHDGRAELDANALLRATRACLDATHDWLCEQRPAAEVMAAGSTCFWHSFLGASASARALTPVITWADARPRASAETLRGTLDERAYHARTGCMLHASFWPARCRWLRTAAAVPAGVRYWLSPGEWLLWRLIGTRQVAHAMATGTGLYDPSKLDWDAQSLALAGLQPDSLSPLADTAFTMGTAARRRWPAFAAAAWYPAIGDGVAGNLGSGATGGDSMALNYGTSAALRIVRRGRAVRVPFGMFGYRIDATRYLVGGATSNAGAVRAWALDTLQVPLAGRALDRWIATRDPDAHGLDVLPFLSGERAPYWRDDLSGAIRGLRLGTGALDITAALTEASYHRLALIAAHLPGARRRTAVVSGALVRSHAALRSLADVTGLRLRPCLEPEGSLRGAAVYALEHMGRAPPAPRYGAELAPDPQRARKFARLRRRHADFERQLTRPV